MSDDRYLLPSRRRSEATSREMTRLLRDLYARSEAEALGVGPEQRAARLRESVTGEKPRMSGLMADLLIGPADGESADDYLE